MTPVDGRSPALFIAVPTFRRTAGLAELVSRVRVHTDAYAGRTRIALIDNDPERSAEPFAADLSVGYHSERTPGIAAVRQRALDVAAADELLIMIDDDTEPQPGWLSGLVDVWRETDAAVVVGHVDYVWPVDADPWIAAGGFMRRVRYPRGAALRHVATGNVLLDVGQVRRLGVGFDTGLGLSGGEDSMFGSDLLAAGGTIAAASDSVVRDDIPPERCTVAFVRRRATGHGRSRTRLELRGRRGMSRVVGLAVALLGAVARLAVFGARRVVARLRGDDAAHAVATRRFWLAQGRISGVFGARSDEYDRP